MLEAAVKVVIEEEEDAAEAAVIVEIAMEIALVAAVIAAQFLNAEAAAAADSLPDGIEICQIDGSTICIREADRALVATN